jgi:hypothetical protein
LSRLRAANQAIDAIAGDVVDRRLRFDEETPCPPPVTTPATT